MKRILTKLNEFPETNSDSFQSHLIELTAIEREKQNPSVKSKTRA